MTQEQLADVYFSGSEKLRKSDSPLVIRVIEKQKGGLSIAPWTIASVAFFLLAFSLFSTKRVWVDIKVMDEKSPYVVNAGPPATASDEALLEKEAGGSNESQATLVPLQEFVFEGAAYLKSSRDANLLTLVNSSVAPFARATINFDRPVNLHNGKIVFYAKGAKGGESLGVALKDDENNQAFIRGKVYPYPHGLSTAWQKTEILLSDTSREFDAKRAASLRFEFGSKDTTNRPGDTILIKDLRWYPSAIQG